MQHLEVHWASSSVLTPSHRTSIVCPHQSLTVFTMASQQQAPIPPSGENGDTTDHDNIHDRLEFYFNSLSRPWKAPLLFSMHVGPACALGNDSKEIDICAFISGDIVESSLYPFAYFDRSQFPYVDQPRVSSELHRGLVHSAAKAGFHLAGNGSAYSQ